MLGRGFSRTCGGDPIVLTIQENGFEFFPHMRGWSWRYAEPGQSQISFSRTRGGDPKEKQDSYDKAKFFPHTRGWSHHFSLFTSSCFVFPALAGVILSLFLSEIQEFRFSRTRGGDPSSPAALIISLKFFPHTRGWSRSYRFDNLNNSVFPAHAGVIPDLRPNQRLNKGFSRTRGGLTT